MLVKLSILISLVLSENIKFEPSKNSTNLPPIVLVPGLLGSVLEAKLDKDKAVHYVCYNKADWFRIWVNTEVLIPGLASCWVDNMRLDFDGPATEPIIQNVDGVQIRTPNWGNPDGSIDYLDPGSRKWDSIATYFAYMTQTLVSRFGYIRGENLVAAPFDWRLAPNFNNSAYCYKLLNLIELTYKNNSYQKVTIVAHSMGNLFFHHCYKRVFPYSWRKKHIKNYVAIGGPWAGAPKSLKMITSGENQRIPVLSPNLLRIAERSWPCTYLLLPNPLLMTDKVLLQVDGYRNYTASQYRDFFSYVKKTQVPADDNSFQYSDALYAKYSGEHIIGNIESLDLPTTCICGVNVDTTETLHWYKKSKFPDYTPYETSGSGDGTVPAWSCVDSCKKMERDQATKEYPKKFETLALDGVEHVTLLFNDVVMQKIYEAAGLKIVEGENKL